MNIAPQVIGIEMQRQHAQVESKVASYNAMIAEREAQAHQARAIAEARQFRQERRRQEAGNRARIGASGLALEGTPLLVLEENAAATAMDALTIQREGLLARDRARYESSLYRAQKRNLAIASRWRTASGYIQTSNDFSRDIASAAAGFAGGGI